MRPRAGRAVLAAAESQEALLRHLDGERADVVVADYDQFMSRVHPDDRQFVARSVERALQDSASRSRSRASSP